tara:strand:+ start:528 stop:1355 length:828 start_codon:yes stop_codon:yes gene_type:complete
MNKSIFDAYVTMNIHPTCSEDDLKKQYRKLCLQYHPDKYHGDSTEFIKIKDAYNRIINSHDSQDKSDDVPFLNPEDLKQLYMYMMVFGLSFFSDKKIHLYIDVEINDIYSSKIKRIKYSRINANSVKESNVVFLELHGLQNEYCIHERGDYNMFTKSYTDLIIHVQVVNTVLPCVTYEPVISPYELYITISITIYEYYFGIDRSIPYLNNEQLKIQWLPVKQGTTIIMDGFGLPDQENKKNNLYCMLNVDLSCNNLEESHHDIIYKLFGTIHGIE